ncbi:MAG: hypothetical protein IJI40_08260, partial [Firmicutes bacterium]|nr:hypothetical protein [Bacillota bacterium]
MELSVIMDFKRMLSRFMGKPPVCILLIVFYYIYSAIASFLLKNVKKKCIYHVSRICADKKGGTMGIVPLKQFDA